MSRSTVDSKLNNVGLENPRLLLVSTYRVTRTSYLRITRAKLCGRLRPAVIANSPAIAEYYIRHTMWLDVVALTACMECGSEQVRPVTV